MKHATAIIWNVTSDTDKINTHKKPTQFKMDITHTPMEDND